MPATLRSLFRKKEQAPSSPVYTLTPEDAARAAKCLQAWIDGKGYRLPDRTPHESAERMGVDFRMLHQYCLLHLGVDFRRLRTRLRIRDAQLQMKGDPGTPTAVIARRVGYQDRSNFSRHFKEMTGLTPDDWRKKQADYPNG